MSDDGTVSVRVGEKNYAYLLRTKHDLERAEGRTASLDEAIGHMIERDKSIDAAVERMIERGSKKRAKKSEED